MEVWASYAFAMVANSQKWLVGEYADFANTASLMILDAMRSRGEYFAKWYKQLVPDKSRLLNLSLTPAKSFSQEYVKRT